MLRTIFLLGCAATALSLTISSVGAPRASVCMSERVLTTGDVKVKFNEALAGRFDVNPRHMQIPMQTQSFVNEMITTTTLSMVQPNYRYTRLFALGFETLCDQFLPVGCSADTAKYVRSSLLEAFEMDEAKVKADAEAYKALIEGKTEAELFETEDFKGIKASKITYTYLFGAGLTLTMAAAGVKVDRDSIARWCDALNLNCKNALTRDYEYYETNVVKAKQMQEMLEQMEASSKRQEAEREAEKAKRQAEEAKKMARVAEAEAQEAEREAKAEMVD